MKKILSLLATVFFLFSCTSDDSRWLDLNGRYVNLNQVLSVSIKANVTLKDSVSHPDGRADSILFDGYAIPYVEGQQFTYDHILNCRDSSIHNRDSITSTLSIFFDTIEVSYKFSDTTSEQSCFYIQNTIWGPRLKEGIDKLLKPSFEDRLKGRNNYYKLEIIPIPSEIYHYDKEGGII